MRKFCQRALALGVASAVAGAALAYGNEVAAQSDYPQKTVTMVVPFAAGGRTDLTARSVAEGLQKHLGTNVIVVNKPGAGGVVGALDVAEAAPDGYTVGLFSSAVVSAQYTVKDGTNLEDYKVGGVVEVSPAAVAVQADSDWKSLEDLVKYGKANPGEVKIGMIPGASAQVFAGGFTDAAGFEATMVPFDSDAPGVAALAGGHIDAHVAVPASYKPLLEADQIRVLGVAAANRMSSFPNIATMREQGVDLNLGSFHALFVPKDTSEEVVDKLESALAKAMQEQAVTERMANVGLGPVFMNRLDGRAYIAEQDAAYKRLITAFGLMHESEK